MKRGAFRKRRIRSRLTGNSLQYGSLTLEDDGTGTTKDVLLAGESTRKPLMDRYYLSEKADNRYKNKEARILINMESIQAEGGEMETIWGKMERDLGIFYQPVPVRL